MDRVTNPRGLGSSERPVGHTHFLLSPYNSDDREHNSDLLDTYERERISRELEYYIEEAAKSTTTTTTTTNVKSNGVIGSDLPSGNRSRFRRVMSMPRLPPERDTSGGMIKKKISEIKSKETIEASMPPGRDTSGGGGMKKKISEKKSKEIVEALMPPGRDTSGGGGMKKKIETKSKEKIEVSRAERDTRSGGGGGGMKKKSEAKNCKAIIEGNFLLKHASTVCNSSESDVVQFGRDFLRAQVAAGRGGCREKAPRGGYYNLG